MNPEEDTVADYIDRRVRREGPVTERIQTLDDILYEVGLSFTELVPFPHPTNKSQRAQNANATIIAITEVYNEGTILNWSDPIQYKYYLFFQKIREGWYLNIFDCALSCSMGEGHYFKSPELAQDAYNKFKNVWDDYLPE